MILLSLIILIGIDLLMRIIDKENKLPKIDYKQIGIVVITNGLIWFLCNYNRVQLMVVSVYVGIIMYSAFSDYLTKEIYDVPNLLGLIIGVIIFTASEGINVVSLKHMGICVLIVIVLTILKCINWGDTILFISLIPSLCLISNNPVYPYVLIILSSSFLGIVFNLKKFIAAKKSSYAFAPFIYAGYVISVMIYGL
mgnify:CR=1 FL=1